MKLSLPYPYYGFGTFTYLGPFESVSDSDDSVSLFCFLLEVNTTGSLAVSVDAAGVLDLGFASMPNFSAS